MLFFDKLYKNTFNIHNNVGIKNKSKILT